MLCWGDGAGGQLGRKNINASTTTPVRGDVSAYTITKIACGEQHTLLLDEHGSILSFGSNSKGQLGRQKNKDPKLTMEIKGLEGVVSMACGQAHSLSLNASGQVFSWGAGGEGQLGIQPAVSKVKRPRHVPILSPHTLTMGPIPLPLPIPVRQVACGNFHSLALTTGGEVFSWGLNSHGQLGLGKGIQVQDVPALVRSLTGVPVTQVSAGGAHTLVLTLPGLVYCCGANKAGQLGLNRVDEKGRFTIRDVPALRSLDVSLISCGAAHSAVLTKNGRVFTFGEGSHGQLGHNSTDNELVPKLVEGTEGLASQVACGSQHTLVLGTSRQLWAFGSGVKGQLGIGSTEDSLQPSLVQLPWVSGGAEIPDDLKIAAGWNSNFVYMTTAMVFTVEKPIRVCDEAQLQEWMGDIHIAQREISLMFSTSSNLVASFTKDRECTGDLGVDIEAASQAFEQLLNTPWIRQAVTILPMVQQLFVSSAVMKSPEIFVILPTCPLLREDDSVMNMVLPLAKAILDLNEANMKTLRDWWSTMGPAMMTKHILVWKQALSFLLRNSLLAPYNPGVKFLLQVLKHLHRANKRAAKSRKVPDSTFYVDEIYNHVPLDGAVELWRFWSKLEDENGNEPAIFCRYPFLLNLLCKIKVFNVDAAIKKIHRFAHEMSKLHPQEGIKRAFHLKLRRPSLIEDTFRQLATADDCSFQRELVVQFVEDMKLTLVNNRDFFLHVFDELLAPDSGMFMYNDTETLVWFPAKPGLEEKNYFLFGVLCGIALYNHNIVHLPFPLALFKKLVNVQPSLDDMREFDPAVGESLRYLSEDYMDDDVETNLDMTFSVVWDGLNVELDPEELEKPVTSTNKKKFVDAYVNHAFSTSVAKVFDVFKRGFFKVCDRDVVEFFQPEELRGVMVGKEDYDWEKLQQNTAYEAVYHAGHPSIIMFWEVFEELTADQKKAFLLFLTGCDRVPIQGMDTIKMMVAVLPNATQQHFPESLTCHFLLRLPIYHSKETLRAKLVEAVNHNRGFFKK